MAWRTSSKCDSRDCVQVGFQKSTRSGNADWCVEVGSCSCHQDMVLVRDSKELRFTDTPQVLSFSRSEWDKFLGDLPVRNRA